MDESREGVVKVFNLWLSELRSFHYAQISGYISTGLGNFDHSFILEILNQNRSP